MISAPCPLWVRFCPCLVLAHVRPALFFAMLLRVSDRCLFRMSSGVNGVRSSGVSVMGGLLMMSGLVMLSRFPVMPGSVREMF
jgi:hypothetical protein